MVLTLQAKQDTFLKKSTAQAATLSEEQKASIREGQTVPIEKYQDLAGKDIGHTKITLIAGEETYIYTDHWLLPWDIEVTNPDKSLVVTPGSIDWDDWSSPVSTYFTVGEVCNMQEWRIPTDDNAREAGGKLAVIERVIKFAKILDGIREDWGGPLGVNSWYRPWSYNRSIGSKAPNHPNGYGVDLRPLNGNLVGFQNWARARFDSGEFRGGLGLGARKGFVHFDNRNPRVWVY